MTEQEMDYWAQKEREHSAKFLRFWTTTTAAIVVCALFEYCVYLVCHIVIFGK